MFKKMICLLLALLLAASLLAGCTPEEEDGPSDPALPVASGMDAPGNSASQSENGGPEVPGETGQNGTQTLPEGSAETEAEDEEVSEGYEIVVTGGVGGV